MEDTKMDEMHVEIKDKVISKNLFLIEQQAKELLELKKENTLLKNQLTYILKRILLNKNDYTSAIRTNRLNNLNSSINYNRSMIIKENNRKSNSMLRPLHSVGNYRIDPEKIASRYQEANKSELNILGNENTNNNVDNQVNKYLNSLYRHNFYNSNKNGGNISLSKNQPLSDELFINKNSSFYLNTENNEQFLGNEGVKKNKSKKQRETNSTERRPYKKGNMGNNGTKNNSTGKRYRSKYLNISNLYHSNKKRNKENNDLVDKNKYNTITNYTQKNNAKKNAFNSKRSPFLTNKF